MEAIHLHRRIETDGELRVTGLPCRKGQDVEMILLIGSLGGTTKRALTASALRRSPVVGMWAHRKGIGESSGFARGLRERAQTRER